MARTYEPHADQYSPFEDDYRGFDPRESEEGQRGPLILALALGVLLIFGAIVWNTYRKGVRTGEAGIPVVEAPMGEYKVAHSEIEDAETPVQPVETSTLAYAQVDRIEVKAISADADLIEAEHLKGGPPEDIRRGLTDTKKPEEPKEKPPATQTARKVESAAPREAAGRASTPTESLLREPTLIQTSVPWQTVSNGQFLVQVGAYRTEAAANKAWGQLQSDLPSILGSVGKNVQRADLGAKGIFYRLRANAFPTRSDAIDFCEALKKGGQSCIVVSR